MRRSPATELGACLLLAALGCATPHPVVDQGDTASGRAGAPPLMSGSLLTRYRGRFSGDAQDHDLYETADLTLNDPQGRWQGSVLARAALDLDGPDGPTYFGLMDTYDHRLEGQLFHAYVDFLQPSFALLRLGRQPIYETPITIVLDGVRAELAPLGAARAQLGAYAGLGEHMYEASRSGDGVLGAFGAAHPWSGAELRADWMHLSDERLGVAHQDTLLGLALSQDVIGAHSVSRLDARFTSLGGDGRDVRLLASHADDGARYSLQGSVYHLLQTQDELAAPLDPFSSTLFELFPYTQVGLSATKDWTHFALLGGADVRRVTHASDEGRSNREFERYYLTGTLNDALPVTLAVTGELWSATDADYDTWGATLGKKLDECEVSVGSYYALYEYDQLSAEERDHVRSYYLDLRWKPAPTRRWSLRYSFERNDVDNFQDLRLDYSWGF